MTSPNPVPPVPANPAALPANQPSATDATTAAAAASTNSAAGYTSETTISSLADLKRKAPKVYKFMMQSLCQNICIQINADNDRLVQAWKNIRNETEGY